MEGFGCLVFVLAVIGIFIAMLVQGAKDAREKEQQKKESVLAAEQRYQEALLKLRGSPTDAELKTETLRLGRAYAELAREMHKGDKSVTVFDEVALGNDISAATAGATGTQTPTLHESNQEETSNVTGGEAIEARLEKLAALKDRGLITEDEYSRRRETILDEL